MKRWIGAVLSVVLTGGLVACSSESKPANKETGKGNVEKVELRFAWWGSTQRHELYNKLIDMYEQKNPHVKIIREPASSDDYWNKFATQAVGRMQPDILQFLPARLSEFVNLDVVAPLDDYVKSGKINIADFDPNVTESGKINGKLYIVTKGISGSATFANVDLLKRKGIEFPKSEMSFDQWAEYVKNNQAKLGKNNKGQQIYMLQDQGGWDVVMETFIRQKGKKLVSNDGKQLGFNKADLKEWYTWWDQLRKAGAIPTAEITAEEGGMPWETSMLVNERVTMNMTNGNQLKIFQSYMKDQLEIYRLPTYPAGPQKYGESIIGAYLGISKNTKHPDEVAKFIDFWINDVELNKINNHEHGISGSNKIIKELKSNMHPSDIKVWEHLNEVVRTAPPTEPRHHNTTPILSLIKKTNEEIAFGVKSVDKAVDDFFVASERLLSK